MRIAINYETTKVSFYRFVCNDPEIKSSYVGHTVNFRERKYNHKWTCNNPNNKHYHRKIYEIIRENGGWDNWRMIEIESKLVKDKREGERIETEFMEKFQSDMNIRKSVRTETVNEYAHTYYVKNVDKIKEKYHTDKVKEKVKENIECECGCVLQQGQLPRHKKTVKHTKLMELKNS